jgi:hypothetical protein
VLYFFDVSCDDKLNNVFECRLDENINFTALTVVGIAKMTWVSFFSLD